MSSVQGVQVVVVNRSGRLALDSLEANKELLRIPIVVNAQTVVGVE